MEESQWNHLKSVSLFIVSRDSKEQRSG